MTNLIEKLEKIDNHFKTAKFHSFDNTKDLPKESGVYCIYRDNQVIYIGITDNLKRRLDENFRTTFANNFGNHCGAETIRKIYPNSKINDYQFKYYIENNLNLYSLYERYLIILYEETLLNIK